MRSQHAAILDEIERRRSRLNLSLLRVYHGYCLTVALILLAVFHQTVTDTRLGSLDPVLFVRMTVMWAALNLVLLLAVPGLQRRLGNLQHLVFGLVLLDILVVTTLLYASGGVGSGLGTLLLVTVATAAMLLTGHLAKGVPAVATIAVLYEEFYLALSVPHLHDDYFQAGVLGGLYFAVSIVVRFLSRRIRDKDIRALTQAAELADLEQLNRQIIRRMRTGIAVVGADDQVRMLNDAARELLAIAADQTVERLPEPIGQHLHRWRSDIEVRPRPLQLSPESAEIRVNFSPVRPGDPAGDVIVFLEDTAELQQQALQLKLASLGQLSANIAHEIRNPLSAISHAAQLLRESPDIAAGDLRLTEIIHSHCLRMNGVIENVLTTSRRQPPSPVRLALAEQLAKVIEAFKETTPGAEIELAIQQPDMEVRMDRSQLDQVLTNLMANAVRHSQARSGRLWARLEAGIDPRSERPFLNVIDEGSGVDPAGEHRLFEPFFSTEQGGTGLGLYLSRELCEANQARLSYRPHDSGGACFRISFAHPDRVIA
jgi:two-component system, NtrC family, sensor histidine kinase PilS